MSNPILNTEIWKNKKNLIILDFKNKKKSLPNIHANKKRLFSICRKLASSVFWGRVNHLRGPSHSPHYVFLKGAGGSITRPPP